MSCLRAKSPSMERQHSLLGIGWQTHLWALIELGSSHDIQLGRDVGRHKGLKVHAEDFKASWVDNALESHNCMSVGRALA